MDKYFYQTPEYTPARMTKKELVAYLTKLQDECYDKEVAEKNYRFNAGLRSFTNYYHRDAMKKTVFSINKLGTGICSSMSQLAPFGRDKDPIKVVVAIRVKGGFDVWTFDWDESYIGKIF